MGELAKAGSALTLEIFGSAGKLGALEIGRGSTVLDRPQASQVEAAALARLRLDDGRAGVRVTLGGIAASWLAS